MATPEIEALRAAGFSDDEILAEAGFNGASPEEMGFMGQLAGGQESTLGNIAQWGSDIGSSAWGMVKGIAGIPSAVADAGTNLAHFVSGVDSNNLDAQGNPTPVDRGQMLQTGAETLQKLPISMIPGGRTLNDRFLEGIGYGEEKTAGEYGQSLREDISTIPSLVVAAKAPEIAGTVKGGYQATRDTLFGKPKDVRLAEMSLNDDIYANTLNAASRRTNAEDAIVRGSSTYQNEFTRTNPVAGIDPSQGRLAMEQLEKNLDNIKVEAIKTRGNILPSVAEAEAKAMAAAQAARQPIKIGISYDDLPESVSQPNGLSYGLDHIKDTVPGGDAGVAMARQYVKQEFGIGESGLVDEFGKPLGETPSQVLSATDANQARMRIDNQIREWGGWDNETLYSMKPGLSPSTRDAYVESLKFYRSQLDKAVKGHIEKYGGPEAAKAFDEAGKNIAMAGQYSNLAGRFKRETGQAYAPGSAKALPPGQGPLGTGGMIDKAAEIVSPSIARARMETQALQREGNAIQDLQTLVDLKSGVRSMPAPRGWAQIKTSAEHLFNIGNLAVRMGLIATVDDLVNLPDEIATQVVGQVASAAPFAFEQNPDKVNTMDGKFVDPIGKDLVVKSSLDLPPAERAKRIGASFQNKYIPPTETPIAQLSPRPSPQIDLPSLSSGMDEAMSGNPPQQSSDLTSMLNQLTNAEQEHFLNDYGIVQ